MDVVDPTKPSLDFKDNSLIVEEHRAVPGTCPVCCKRVKGLYSKHATCKTY